MTNIYIYIYVYIKAQVKWLHLLSFARTGTDFRLSTFTHRVTPCGKRDLSIHGRSNITKTIVVYRNASNEWRIVSSSGILAILKSQVVEGATYICARAIMWFFDLSEALRAASILLQLTTCSISSAFRCRHIAWVREHDRRALQVRHVVCPDAHRFEKDMNKSSKSKQQTTEPT